MARAVDLTIDLDSFDKAKWVGHNLVYPEDPPTELSLYYDKIYTVPDTYQKALLPDTQMSISHFIALEVPSVAVRKFERPAEQCFSNDAPIADSRSLLKRDIPNLDFVASARKASYQALLDGYISFVDPQYAADPQPLWIIHFWEQMHETIKAISIWTNCKQWIMEHLNQSATNKVLQDCLIIFDELGWNKPATKIGAIGRTLELAPILADSMIRGGVVDSMILDLRSYLPSCSTYHIETLTFMEYIIQLWRNPGRNIPYLNELEEELKMSKKILFFPVNLRVQKHYQTFKIDFDKCTVCFGDSLIRESDRYDGCKEIINPITWWLSARFGRTFKNLGCIIDRGFQSEDDNISCAFTAINMIAFEVLGEPLWNASCAIYERAVHFKRLASMEISTCDGEKPSDIVMDDPVIDEKKTETVMDVHPFFDNVTMKKDKRKRHIDSDNDEHSELPMKLKRPKRQSAQATHKLNESVENGTFVRNADKWAIFKGKIFNLDANAEFPGTEDQHEDPRYVRHSACGGTFKMKEPYHVERFKIHVGKCKASGKAAGMKTLTSMFNKSVPNASKAKATVMQKQPCPGLTNKDNDRIDVYLSRTPASGGGAPTPMSIAEEMYNVSDFKGLQSDIKDTIKGTQRLQYRWRNEDDLGIVRSTGCTGNALCDGPCNECRSLLKDKIFKNALSREPPPPENVKYTPHIWVNEKVMDKYGAITGLKPIIDAYKKNPRNACLLYAEGVINGHYKEDVVFTSIVTAMVQRKELEKSGKGLQGFCYTPEAKELAQIIFIISPRAYQAIRKVLQLPTPRSLQINRARQPRFPIGIKPETFEYVVQHIKALKYNGPLNLSCDDTQLFAALRPFYDGNTKQFYIMGNVGEPLLLSDPERFSETIKNGSIEKATKLRLRCIQIPMPGIPAIVAAVMAISSACSANDLVDFSHKLLLGFINHGLKILGCSADGSAVERLVQSQLESRAPKRKSFTIKGRQPGQSDRHFHIPLFGENEQGVIMIQDSKHAAKTYRNNGYSGAQFLTTANYPILYEHFRELGVHSEGPLFLRDVERVDRQDDSAAVRFFSSAALGWFVKHKPDQLGPIMYLFVFGELIDAYQNRHIKHVDRLVMVSQAHYFIEIWKRLISTSTKDKSQIISAQALKITETLIDGLIKLIVAYRELPETYPLLPWLYSTEVNEHIFGICRQIVPDFTMLDFYYMTPKLFIRMREASLFKDVSDGRERASGYTATNHDTRDIDLDNLSIYPTIEEMEEANETGLLKAVGIWERLGYSESSSYLSPINQWYRFDADELENLVSEDNDQGLGGVSESSMIQDCLDHLENVSLPGQEYENEVNSLAFASVALTINDSQKILEMPEPDNDERARILDEESKAIQAALAGCLPSISLLNERVAAKDFHPSDLQNLSAFVDIRASHQHRQALTGIRTNGKQALRSLEEKNEAEKSNTSTRYALLRKLNEVVRNLQEKPTTSTVGRTIRWQPGRNPIARDNTLITSTGNSANAAEAAKQRSNDVATRRKNAFAKYGLCNPELISAKVTKFSPLRSGDYGIIVVDNALFVGHVLSVYSKTGGKNGKHAWVQAETAIGSVSNIPMQCYEHYTRNCFRAIPSANRSNRLLKFTLLPSSAFLMKLKHAPSVLSNFDIEIAPADIEEFEKLKRDLQKLMLSIKLISGRRALDVDDED